MTAPLFGKFALNYIEDEELNDFKDLVANCNYVQFIDILLVGDRSAKMSGITLLYKLNLRSHGAPSYKKKVKLGHNKSSQINRTILWGSLLCFFCVNYWMFLTRSVLFLQ